MFDAAKIILGLVIFFCLLTSPIWYSMVSGKAGYVPELEIVTEEKQCIEETQYMRDKHMDLLNDWRESVVRQGNRTYIAGDGREYNISLTGTCMDCHSNKVEFCDRCHTYVEVRPDCWDCHISPEGD